MRKSSVRTLRQENNARERALSRESQREMTDVVVYLRGQDLSPLDQEKIRRDILEMVWEAEARGETGIVNICAVFKPTKLCSFS